MLNEPYTTFNDLHPQGVELDRRPRQQVVFDNPLPAEHTIVKLAGDRAG